MLVDEVCVNGARQELLVLQNVEEERNIRLDAADAEFPQSSIHLRR